MVLCGGKLRLLGIELPEWQLRGIVDTAAFDISSSITIGMNRWHLGGFSVYGRRVGHLGIGRCGYRSGLCFTSRCSTIGRIIDKRRHFDDFRR